MFSNGAYATIWEVKEAEKYCDVRISTSKKVGDKKYEQDFSANVRFVGNAKEVVRGMKEKDRIKIINCGVSNQYNKEKKQLYTNYVVFECENVTGGTTTPAVKPAKDDYKPLEPITDEDLPF